MHEISHNLCKIKCCCKLKMEQIDFSSSSFAKLPESRPGTYIYVLHTRDHMNATKPDVNQGESLQTGTSPPDKIWRLPVEPEKSNHHHHQLAFPDKHFEKNNYDHQSWHSTIITFKIHLVYPVGARMSPPARSPPQRPKVP